MKYTISVHKSNKTNDKTKAFVTIAFGNKAFVITNIRIMEKNDGQLYTVYPSRMVYKNGKPLVKNGETQYENYANPITKEFYDELKNAILNQYKDNIEKQIYREDEDLKYVVSVVPYQSENLLGFGKINFDNQFVVDSIKLHESQAGNLFMQMPGYKKDDEFIDVVYPATSASRKQLTEAFSAQLKNVQSDECIIDDELER